MKPEFIAWDRDKNEWVSLDPNGKQKFLIDMFGRVSRATMLDYSVDYVDLYPYIHRKDMDGNKVYEGSLFERNGHKYEVFYNVDTVSFDVRRVKDGRRMYYYRDRLSINSLTSITGNKVIGHIAEEGVRG